MNLEGMAAQLPAVVGGNPTINARLLLEDAP